MILDISGEFAYEIEATPYGMSISVRVEKPTPLEVSTQGAGLRGFMHTSSGDVEY